MKLVQILSLAAAALCSTSLAQAAQAGGMYIESCNLACNSGAGGAPVFGQIVSVFESQELRIRFSLDVDPSSVDYFSFPIVNIMTGTIPVGTYAVDPWDPRTLVFTPALSFDVNSTPHYGFGANQTYWIRIPGTAQGSGQNFIRSTTGLLNQSSLDHTIQTDLGLGSSIVSTCPTSPNSVGPGAILALVGSNSIFLNSLQVTASSAPPMTMGVFLAGHTPHLQALGQGTLCAGGMLQRLVTGSTDAAGAAQHSVDVAGLAVNPGDLRYLQFWYRDNGLSNLSNGVRIQFYH